MWYQRRLVARDLEFESPTTTTNTLSNLILIIMEYKKPKVTVCNTKIRTTILAGSGGSGNYGGNPCLHCTVKPGMCWMCGNNGRYPKY